MSETPNRILPNSFQTPNFFVDECMSLLTGNEYKCLSFVARKTFGWQKRSDRISKSQIAAATGMNQETVDRSMNALMRFGLVIRVAENNLSNAGVEWALQTNDELIRFDLLHERLNGLVGKHNSRTEKARLKKADPDTPDQPGGTVDEQPGGGVDEQAGGGVDEQPGGTVDGQPGGGVVQQSPQKPIKTKENMGADAPASPVEKTNPETSDETSGEAQPETSPETADPHKARIEAFPEEYRQTVRLMLELFGVHPPEKPAPNEKGGEYALWLKSIQELQKIAQEYGAPLETALRLTCERWKNRPFDVAHPGALKKTMTSVLAQHSRSARPETAPETQDTAPAGPATLPSEELRARMEALRNRRKAQDNV